jgi:hypothetical protein
VNELNQTLDRPPDDGDGLRQIKGIGQAIAQALNSLGIHRYADLVSFTPNSLADLLKAEIPTISSKRIEREDWIGQAQSLAHSQEELEPPRPEADEAPAPSAEGREKDTGKAPRKDWRELADFFVSFGFAIGPEGEERLQTKVHHSQADKPKEWDGIVTDELINWMLNQADLSLPTETEAQVEEKPPAKPPLTEPKVATPPVPVTPYDARVEILEVQVSEVPTPFGVREKKLMAEVRFQISGPEAKTLTTEPIPFRIEVHTVDLESGVSTLVASEGNQLQPRGFEYTRQQAFPLPDIGRYELHTIVLLLPPGEMMAFHRGPTIKVVP